MFRRSVPRPVAGRPGRNGAAVAGADAGPPVGPPDGVLFDVRATICTNGGRWFAADVWMLHGPVYVAVNGSGMYRVIPGPGVWWYAGKHGGAK